MKRDDVLWISQQANIDALRAGIDDYRATFDRILKLHSPGRGHNCAHCPEQRWPCKTARLALAPGQQQGRRAS